MCSDARFCFKHFHRIDTVIVCEGEDIAEGQAGEVSEGVFEDGFWIRDVEEGGGLGLEFNEFAGRKVGGFDLEEIARFEGESFEHLDARPH